MIELKHLKSLHMLRRCGSLAQAADELHLSHSALSHQFHELEHRLGFSLFIRKTQPIHFTEKGELFLKLADSVLPQVQETLDLCLKTPTPTLRLAVECHSCIQWLIPVLSAFKKTHPEVTIDYQSGIVFDPQPALHQGELDVVLTSDKLNNTSLIYQPLFDFEVKLVVSVDHPLAKKTQITPKDLANETVLIYPVQQQRLDIMRYFLKPAGVSVNLKEVDNTSLLIQMVSANMGIAALPHWVIHKTEQQNWVVTHTLGNGLWRTLYAAISPKHQNKQVITAFLDCIRAYAKNDLPFVK